MQIYTDRLFLRNMDAEDWQHIQALIHNFNQSDYRVYDMPLPEEDEAVKALTLRWASSGLFFSVFSASTLQMIGYVCFHNDNGIYDLGYCFHSAYHGNGYAYESCIALMRHMEQTNHIKGFSANTALENTSSCQLLRRLGFTLKKTERMSFHKDIYGNNIYFTGGSFIKNCSN